MPIMIVDDLSRECQPQQGWKVKSSGFVIPAKKIFLAVQQRIPNGCDGLIRILRSEGKKTAEEKYKLFKTWSVS